MNTTNKIRRPYQSMTTDTLKARRQELLGMMPDPAHVIRASLITRSIKCGKPNCRCANGEGHKSLYWYYVKKKYKLNVDFFAESTESDSAVFRNHVFQIIQSG